MGHFPKSKPLKIALVVTDLSPPRMGGISKVATEIFKQFCKKGHRVTVFCLERTVEQFLPWPNKGSLKVVAPKGVLYRDYPVMSFSLEAFRVLLEEQKKAPFDVSHAMNFNNYGFPFYARALRRAGCAHVSTAFETTEMELRAKWKEWKKAPSLHTFAQIAMESYLAPWQKAYIGWADQITTEDRETQRHLIKKGISEEKISLIPSGVDLDYLDPKKVDSEEVKKIKSLGAPLILCPGRVDARKGSQFMVNAFKNVLSKYPKAHLIFAGGGRGDYVKLVERLAQSISPSAITLTGPVKDLRPYYEACDRVVIPSLSEGIPITMQEAMAFAKPLICTELEGTFDWAQSFPGIDWAKPGDVRSLAEACLSSLERDENIEQGLREIIREYDWSNVADRYLEVYRRALAS